MIEVDWNDFQHPFFRSALDRVSRVVDIGGSVDALCHESTRDRIEHVAIGIMLRGREGEMLLRVRDSGRVEDLGHDGRRECRDEILPGYSRKRQRVSCFRR